MKRATMPIAGLIGAILSSTSPATPLMPLSGGAADLRTITKVYYYRPYSVYYRHYYRPYYYNPYYVPYYYYGCRRFYSWGYLRCVW
jgi:hypothetical protein